MDKLDSLLKRSRFITIAPEAKGTVVEANMWRDLSALDPYTINIRGFGKDVAGATDVVLLKMQQLGIE